MKSERQIRSIVARIRKINKEYDAYYDLSLTEFEREGIEHCRNTDISSLLEGLNDKEMDMLNTVMFGYSVLNPKKNK